MFFSPRSFPTALSSPGSAVLNSQRFDAVDSVNPMFYLPRIYTEERRRISDTGSTFNS